MTCSLPYLLRLPDLSSCELCSSLLCRLRLGLTSSGSASALLFSTDVDGDALLGLGDLSLALLGDLEAIALS